MESSRPGDAAVAAVRRRAVREAPREATRDRTMVADARASAVRARMASSRANVRLRVVTFRVFTL